MTDLSASRKVSRGSSDSLSLLYTCFADATRLDGGQASVPPCAARRTAEADPLPGFRIPVG
jgi:hypothetical protein